MSNHNPLGCAGHPPFDHPVVLPHSSQSQFAPQIVQEPAPAQLERGLGGFGEQTLPGTTSHGHVSLTMVGCGVGREQIGLPSEGQLKQLHVRWLLFVHVLPFAGYVPV